MKTLDGKNRAFSVPDEITVKQFKKTIAASIEIKAEIQRLIFKGRILCDDHKINDYDVNGKTIHVVQKLPPVSSASTSSTVTTSASTTDSLPVRSRDVDDIGRSGRRIFLGSYSLASDGTNIVQQMLDDLGDVTMQDSRHQTQNPEEGTSSSVAGVGPAPGAPNRATNEPQNRLNQIKKLIASAKKTLESLESPNADVSASFDEGEQSDLSADQSSSSAEQGTSAEGSNGNNPETQNSGSSVISDLLDEVMLINERLHPHLVLYQQLMRDDAVLQDKKMEEAKQLSTLVPRTLHLVSHIYHNLSDLSVNIAAPPPRQIVAPPMRRQATAIFQQSIPVLQAEISLSGGPLVHPGGLTVSSAGTRSTSAPTEPIDSAAGSSGPRFFSTLSRAQVVGLSSAASSTSSSAATYSSVFPLFLSSSSVGSSILPSALPPWLSAAVTSTGSSVSSGPAASAAAVSSPASLNSVTLTTDSLNRTPARRGFRRFAESSTRGRPAVSISTHDVGESFVRPVDPYLTCHSRHFRATSSVPQPDVATSRNSNQSLSDIISGLVSSIMTTPGGPADVTASGRHGNSDDISTSFTTRIDSSLREFHEQLLDDPEIEEEVIGTWHPLDSSSSFVRNIFGSSDRVNDNAQSNSQSFPRATSVLEDFLDIMNNDSRSDENWMELLIRQVLSIFSFSDILSILNGDFSLLGRVRLPLQDFVRSAVLNGREATDDNLNSAVEHLSDDLYYFLEETVGDADVMREVDFVASLISFLKHHMRKIFGVIMKSKEEADLIEELPKLCHQMAIEFVCLCEGCLRNDGFMSFVQHHLFFPYGVHSAVGSWMRDQFRSFRRSILPNPLQAIVCEQHVVFYHSLNTLNDSDSPAAAAAVPSARAKERSSENPEEAGVSARGNTLVSSDTLEQKTAVKDQKTPYASESEKSTQDNLPSHLQKTSNCSAEDVQQDGPPLKRQKIMNCDEDDGFALSLTSVQNNIDRPPQSSENGTSPSNNLRGTEAASVAEALTNGIDGAPRTLDFKDASNCQQ